jgi:cytochrome P450/NADPH-cytochrome P450 reductase
MSTTPMVMICAGTGLAPFRGFVEERAVMIGEGHRALAPALLFIGCRSPEIDQLYKSEFEEWERIGAVKIRCAFSRAPEASEGCQHVQDRLWHDRAEVSRAFQAGAKFYICGSREVAKSLGEVAKMMVAERHAGQYDVGEADAEGWLEQMRNQRFVSDIFT